VSRLVKTLVVLVIAAALVGGLTYYFLFKRGLRGALSVTGLELWVDPGAVTEASTPLEVHIGVNNSFPVSVKIGGGGLRIALCGLTLATVGIPAQEVKQGFTVLAANAVLDNTLLDEFWYCHLSSGEKSNVTVEGSIEVSTPVGPLRLPVKYLGVVETRVFPVERELNREYDAGVLGRVVLRKLAVELVEVTPSETRLRASITVENKLKAIPLYVNWIVFSVKTGGGLTLGTGEQETPKLIAPGEVDAVVFSIVIDNSKIPKLWVEHLKNKEKTSINIEVWLRINVAGRGIEVFREHPLVISTVLETSIFEYKV